MNQITVIANLKMNVLHRNDIVTYCDHLRAGFSQFPDLKKNVEIIVVPSLPHCDVVVRAAKSEKRIVCGAQGVFAQRRGSYTGEISPVTLADSSVKYVLLGHSEQRTYGRVRDSDVAASAKASLEEGLTPVIFIGETADEREHGYLQRAITDRITAITDVVREQDIARCIFVYEPVWAIGAQTAPSAEDIMSARILMQRVIVTACGTEHASAVRFFYGGSVTPENATMFTPSIGISGVVLGRSGLSYQSVLRIAATIAHNFK